jgi:alkylation response protein AidB-like acyl-CoA dehydrogenase
MLSHIFTRVGYWPELIDPGAWGREEDDMTMVARKSLSDDLIKRCDQRAFTYDRHNKFFTEDFEELRNANSLTLNIPKEFGGQGLSLAETGKELRRLAYPSPSSCRPSSSW